MATGEGAIAAPVDEHRFACAQCGATYRFDPESGALVCAHCGDRQPIRSGPWTRARLKELDFDAASAQDLPDAEMEETRVLSCPNCAAQVAFDADLHARDCPFCATPVVTDTGMHRHVKPRGVLPFALNEEAARAAMRAWLDSLWFAPDGLQQYARKRRAMQGIYLPYWTFDADTASRYTGERGIVYYETHVVRRNGKTSRVQIPKVRWRRVSGRVARLFDDVLVIASHSLRDHEANGLAPWDLRALEPYRPEFLAGFRAEGYAVVLPEGYEAARRQMAGVIERDVRFDIGGDRQRIHAIETDIRNVTFKHILLPVCLAAYRYRGATYRVVVNAQTGRVTGERPWSRIKIAMAVLLGLLVAAAGGYLMALAQ